MALSIGFRWKTPTIQAPDTMWNRTGASEGVRAFGQGLERKRTRERQERLDKIAEEDRQRRNAWEDKQRQAYGEAADYMRNRSAEREALVKRAEEIRAEIASLKAQLGG